MNNLSSYENCKQMGIDAATKTTIEEPSLFSKIKTAILTPLDSAAAASKEAYKLATGQDQASLDAQAAAKLAEQKQQAELIASAMAKQQTPVTTKQSYKMPLIVGGGIALAAILFFIMRKK